MRYAVLKQRRVTANMKAFVYVFILVLTLLYDGYCWRIFSRGRQVGGNLGTPVPSTLKASEQEVKEQWFIQQLDHFNPTDLRVWKQRYYTNDQFFKRSVNGPIFLMIGGEGEASVKWMTNGAWIDYAERFGALCFQVEHRYYGKSHPTEDLSTKNLQYLTSQQALADIAAFIGKMNERYGLSPSVKWIVFGGSYPGSLAAWMRLKYPHLVHGAMSASGPLLALVDFQDFFRVVDESLVTYSEKCLNQIKDAIWQLDVYIHFEIGQNNLNKIYKLCDPIQNSANNTNDVSNFYETVAGNFASIVQYNRDNRIGGNPKAANITIDTVCDIMTNYTIGGSVDRLAAVNSLLLDAYDQKCFDYKYDKMVNELRKTNWSSETAEGGRQWTYQTCTEFGFFQTSSHAPQIFGNNFPVDFFIQQCVDIFGPKFNSAFLDNGVERTNAFYGGLNVDVTNVVFVHGSIDPWHALGITKTVNQGAPAIYIDGTAHCANMYPKSDNDLPQLKAAREEIAQHIDTWIRL